MEHDGQRFEKGVRVMFRELDRKEMMNVEGGQLGLSLFAAPFLWVALALSGFLSLGLWL
jgi:hypothetical protein